MFYSRITLIFYVAAQLDNYNLKKCISIKRKKKRIFGLWSSDHHVTRLRDLFDLTSYCKKKKITIIQITNTIIVSWSQVIIFWIFSILLIFLN